MSTYPVSPELAARPSSSCSDAETTPRSLTGDTTPRLTRGVVRRLREQLEQAEAELEANKAVIRDSQLAKHREQLLSFSSVEPGLVLMSVPEGHSASAKEIQCIKADQMKIIAEYEQIIQALSMTAKSQQTQKRCAHKDLLKLRENLASSSGRSSSAQSSADLEVSSLVQELSGVYRRLDEAKQQLVGLQNEQAQLFAMCEAKTQSAAVATAEELEDVTAFLQEANSYNATLASDLEYAHRQHSELHSKLSLQIEYLQRDVEVAQREGDAARRSLRDSKEAHVQALHAQSAAFDQTLDDAKTVAAQDILKFAAALDESQRKESEAVQRLQWSQLELHQQTAALRGEVVESRNKHMQCAQQLQDAEEELEQVHQVIAKLEQQVSSLTAALEDSKQREGLTAHKLSRCEQQLQTEVAALQVKLHEANSRARWAETSLAAAQAKEQDLTAKLACKHANQEKLQAQVCSLALQLDGALASPHQGSGSQLGQLRKEVLRLTDKLSEQQSKTAQAEAAATLMQISADLTKQGTGSQLRQLQKEVLSLADKLAEQQSKTAQAEAAGTLMQLSVDLTKQVSDANPRPASPLVAFSTYSPLALAHSTSPSEAASLTTDILTHVTLSEPLGARALGMLSPLTPVSPAVGLSATALTALSGMSHCSPLVRPSAPALRALPSITPASSALHACAPASRALFSLSLADGSVLQSAPALKAPSSLSSVGAVPDSPDTRRTLSSGGEHTRLQTPIALAHMPSPLQTAGPTASLGPTFTPAGSQLLPNSAPRDFVQNPELVPSDSTPPPPLVQSDALTDSTDQIWTPACSQLLSAARLSECGQIAASAGLLLTGGTSSRLRRSPGPATNSPSPACSVLSFSPVANSAASQPRIPVRQTKKQQAMMDSVDGKLVKAMPGTSASVSLKNAAVHSPEGMSVHSASLQRESRMSLSKAGGRSPFGDMTNNIGYRLVTPDRIPKLPQDVSKTTARSRFSIGDRSLAATMSNPSPAANRRLSMPIIAGSAQQGQENTPPPIHSARQTVLGNDLAGSSRHTSCRVRHSSDMMSFPGFMTGCSIKSSTSPLETGAPKRSAGATGVTMGMVDREPVTSVRRNQADSAITMVLALGSPIRPPSLGDNTCTDSNTFGMLCGSPANPSSISRSAFGFPVQSTAPSGASLSLNIGKLQPASDSAADSCHSKGQEGSNSDEKAAAQSSPAKGSHMPTAADTTGKPKRGRARKAAPAVPSAVKTRSQIAQEKHLHRMQLRSG
ncbi:MAG: hypothetical protein FRX49_10125 [Trebouxia sp. A1-2]|nr:MAG: hypothetical protein FRX49_10125 [Trebouxia sp. A1-2]